MYNPVKRVPADIAVVIVGLEADGRLDRNPRRMCEECVLSGLETYRVDYENLNAIPRLTARSELVVMLYFPHRFWEMHCEVPDASCLYGASWTGYNRFRDFFLEVEGHLATILAGRRVAYLVPPGRAHADRDKVETVKALAAAGVMTPVGYETRDLDALLGLVEPERGVFIKCRFGAEGKGITYLSRDGWWTNYRVEGETLGNHGVHDPWPFTQITGRRDLLEQLLANEVIVEQEIVTPSIEPDTKFDIRAYVSAGVSPHMFLRINNRDAIITNFSQGGRTEHRFAEALRSGAIRAVRRTALAAARALDCPFIGVDLMFDRDGSLAVVEAQVFTDYSDIRCFNVPKFVVGQIQPRHIARKERLMTRAVRRGRYDH